MNQVTLVVIISSNDCEGKLPLEVHGRTHSYFVFFKIEIVKMWWGGR